MINEDTVTLSDGRTLGLQCLGDPEGTPLLYFHGSPGSRLELSQSDRFAQIPGIRIIAPERPGYGLSTPQPERSLLDWAGDVAELADQLGIDAFVVAAASGGGPHALACGHQLPSRVKAVLLFASPAPAGFKGATRGMSLGNRIGLLVQRRAPGIMGWLMRYNAKAFAKNPERFLAALIRQLPAPDRTLLESDAARQAFIRDLQEAYRQGGGGHETDGALAMTAGDWGFALEAVRVPVYMWHGLKDTLVSENMARALAATLPNCESRFVPQAGHLLLDRPAVVDEVSDLLRTGPLARN